MTYTVLVWRKTQLNKKIDIIYVIHILKQVNLTGKKYLLWYECWLSYLFFHVKNWPLWPSGLCPFLPINTNLTKGFNNLACDYPKSNPTCYWIVYLNVEVKIINLVHSGMVSKLSKRKSCILVFTDAVKTLVGEENKRRGTIKMFEVLQDTRLNKQLFYVSNLSFPLKIHF
jgi:hypothetical protein